MSEEKKKVICFGEVLWDMLPGGKEIGGAPLNVAYHLQKLGVDSVLVSKIGKDEYGDEIRDFLNKKKMPEGGLQTDPSYPTGKVGVTLHPNQEVSYEIFQNTAWDFIELNHELDEMASKTKYIVFGSLVTRNQLSRDTLLHLLNRIPVKIFDVNLREPFYSKQIIHELLEKADMVKMNEAELDIIAGWFNAAGNQLSKVKTLYEQFHLKTVIITAGEKGSYAFSNGHYIFKEAYKIEVADTIGAGDSFLAGFLSGYLKEASLEQSLETANKMGALVAQKHGGCPDYHIEELNEISYE